MTTDTKADRRERIATAAMAAIIGKAPYDVAADHDRIATEDQETARGAVSYADALIAELDARAEEKVPELAPKVMEPPQSATTGTDPYPADVLAACPKAREWGVVLWGPSTGALYEWRTSDEANFWPPTVPPPGYVEPKPEPARSTCDGLDRLAEVLHNVLDPRAVSWDKWGEAYKQMRRKEAHAVRMAVLREEPSEEEVEAALRRFKDYGGISKLSAMKYALKAARQARIDAAEKEKP